MYNIAKVIYSLSNERGKMSCTQKKWEPENKIIWSPYYNNEGISIIAKARSSVEVTCWCSMGESVIYKTKGCTQKHNENLIITTKNKSQELIWRLWRGRKSREPRASSHQVSLRSLHSKRFPRFSVSPSSSPQYHRIWSGFKIRALRYEVILNIKYH